MHYCNSVYKRILGRKQATRGFPVSGGFSGILDILGVLGGRGVLREETQGRKGYLPVEKSLIMLLRYLMHVL